MSNQISLPRFDGSTPFAMWRKEVERLFPARQVQTELAHSSHTRASAHLSVMVELVISIDSPARERIEDLPAMKIDTWKAKFDALSEGDRKINPNWYVQFIEEIKGNFEKLDTAVIRQRMNSWTSVPRSQLYSELPGAVSALSEGTVWDHLMSIVHSSIREALAHLKVEELNTVGFVTFMKSHDSKLALIFRNPVHIVPISSLPQEFFSPPALPSAPSTSSGETTVQVNVKNFKPAKSRSTSRPKCHICGRTGHAADTCFLNPQSKSFRPDYLQKLVQAATAKSGKPKRSMFHVGNVEGNSGGYPEDPEDDDTILYTTKSPSPNYPSAFSSIKIHPLQPTAIPAIVGGIGVSLLADTGASDNGIQLSRAKPMIGEWETLPKPIPFKYAEGQGTVKQTFTTKIKFADGPSRLVKFMVFPTLACDVLLGKKFLESAGAVIDYPSHTVSLYGHALPMLNKPKNAHIPSIHHISDEHNSLITSIASRTDINKSQKAELRALLDKYKSVFEEKLEKAGAARVKPARLGLKLNPTPKWTPYSHTTPEAEAVLQEVVEMMVKKGQAEQMRLSSTTKGFNSRIRLVEKKDKSYRPTINLIRVNDETLKDTTPLPRIETLTDELAGANLYFKLDFSAGFDQIPLDEEDRHVTAFSTATRRYQLTTLPQGATNSPVIFQKIVEELLHGIPKVRNYIDDILGACLDWNDFVHKLESVLSICNQYNLKLKPSKCILAAKQVEFLGFLLSKDGKRPCDSNVKAILEMPKPESASEIETFLGLANYYRTFVKNFADLEAPLRDATKDFKWTESQDRPFNAIKFAISLAPTLSKISPNAQLIINTDCSNKGMGATLTQLKNGKEHPIAFWSRMLTKAEKNYPTIKKELAAMYHAVKRFKPFIHMRPVTIYTDHKPLIGFIRSNSDDLENPEATWVLHLASPNITIHYKKGSSNTDADALSRLPVVSMMVDVGSWEEAQRADPFISNIRMEMDKGKVEFIDAELIDDLLYKRMNNGRLVLVVPRALVPAVLAEAHNDSYGGHFGANKTFTKIARYYAWPGMWKDVENFCKACQSCIQKHRSRMQQGIPANLPIGEPWGVVAVDTVGPFKQTRSGNEYYILAVDLFTHNIEVRAIPNHKAATIKKFILEQIFWTHGIPNTILSDNAKEYVSQAAREAWESVGAQGKTSTPYNPQGNGVAERHNGTFNSLLRMAIGGDINSTDWDTYISAAVFAYRCTPHKATGETPFYLEHFRDPRLPLQSMLPGSPDRDIATWKDIMSRNLKQIHEMAKLNMIRNQVERNERISASQPPISLNEGELVWLHVDQVEGSTKFYWPWKGPYRITAKLTDQVYELRDIYNSDLKIPKVNIRRLRPVAPTLGPTHPPVVYISEPSPNPDAHNHLAIPPTRAAPITIPHLETFPDLRLKAPTSNIPSDLPPPPVKPLPQPTDPATLNHPTSVIPPIPATPNKQALANTPANTPDLVQKGRQAVTQWMDSHDISRKGMASEFRTQLGPFIKSAIVAGDIEKIIRTKGMSTGEKIEKASERISKSTLDQWNPLPEWTVQGPETP